MHYDRQTAICMLNISMQQVKINTIVQTLSEKSSSTKNKVQKISSTRKITSHYYNTMNTQCASIPHEIEQHAITFEDAEVLQFFSRAYSAVKSNQWSCESVHGVFWRSCLSMTFLTFLPPTLMERRGSQKVPVMYTGSCKETNICTWLIRYHVSIYDKSNTS